MTVNKKTLNTRPPKPTWYKEIAKYQETNLQRAIWQIINTFIPYFTLLYLMIRSIQLGYSYWITLLLAIPAGGLLIRIFIFFHDCTHNSFFASRKANRIFGYICGILTFTPYESWGHAHWKHHATAANLDHRGTGDVWTMTVEEYQNASSRQRLAYRVFRTPLVTFTIGPLFIFLLSNRFHSKQDGPKERMSVIITNVALLAIILLASFTIGFRTYLLTQLPILIIAATAGVWLFYVQHQFEGVYWARDNEWDFMSAAMKGSSYYKLPKVLQWFTGNIGLHHIHHLRPRIPNYNLQQCYDETPEVREVEPLTIRRSLKSLGMNLWDEERQTLVSFSAVKA
ncbi:MAG: fatty acid desaturase [Anaerolineae bacterium]|nr:fatty acid desaturase [Anaerolineae bacterium]